MTDLSIETIEHLDFEFAPPCEAVDNSICINHEALDLTRFCRYAMIDTYGKPPSDSPLIIV